MKKKKSKYLYLSQNIAGQNARLYIFIFSGLLVLIALLKPEWIKYVLGLLK